MLNKVKRYIRDNENILVLAAYIYRLIGCNSFKGKRKAKVEWRGAFIKHCKIDASGVGNVVTIGKGCRLKKCQIRIIGNNNKINILNDCVGSDLNIWMEDSGNEITIGHNTRFTGYCHLACIEGTNINVGERCLFSSDVIIRTGDSHSILNMDGKRTNLSMNISIGDHVWIGNKVIILKGTEISDDSVVGTGAIVIKQKFEKNSMIVGSPAKAGRTRIDWSSQRN